MSDLLRWLEHIYQTAFGRENLSPKTRDMLLYGQLQEDLSYSLMESPSVSGAQNYQELCITSKKEELRLAELKKKQQYLKTDKLMFETTKRRSFQVILVVLRNLLEVAGANIHLMESRSHYDVMFVTAHTTWHVIVIKTKQRVKTSYHHRKKLKSLKESR